MTGNDWQRRAVKSLKRLLSRLFREARCRFVIGRPRVQLSPSAPKFVGSSPIYEEENSDASQSARWRWLGQIVTSEMVLTELLNSFSDYGPRLRQAAARAVASLRDASEIVIIPQTTLLFERALKRYQEMTDKNWSLTDCASFLIM